MADIDRLTVDRIKKDYMKMYKVRRKKLLKRTVLFGFYVLVFALLVVGLVSAFGSVEDALWFMIWSYGSLALFSIYLVVFYTKAWLSLTREYVAMSKGDFIVARDVVAETKRKKFRAWVILFCGFWPALFYLFLEKKPCTLVFSRAQDWKIPNVVNYPTSAMHHRTDGGIYDYTSIGDEFYVVVYGNGEVALAYHTKYFSYDEAG